MNINTPTTHSCFLSMKYGHASIDPVRDIIEDAMRATNGDENNNRLSLYRSDENPKSGCVLRKKIIEEIDSCLIFICELSVFNWTVAYEMIYAFERKPCIMLLQDPLPGNIVAETDVHSLYSEIFFTKYSLENKEKRNKLREELITIINEKKQTIQLHIREIINIIRNDDRGRFNIIPIANKYIDQRFTLNNNTEISEPDFIHRFVTHNDAKPVVVISPPGNGKSAFLKNMIKTLNKNKDRDINHPLVLYINLASINPINEIKTDWPWGTMKELVNKAILHNKINSDLIEDITKTPFLYEGILDAFIKKGLIYLILDSLDEFGMKYKDNVRALLNRTLYLAHIGIKVIITCREFFWDPEYADEHTYDTCKILPFNQDQARELLQKKTIQKALDVTKGNPFLLSIIRNPESNKKVHIYTDWVNHIADEDGKRFKVNPETIKKLFGIIAEILSKNRELTITNKIIDEALQLLDNTDAREKMKGNTIYHSGFFIGNEDYRNKQFVHLSIMEYFLATKIASDFKKVIKSKTLTNLEYYELLPYVHLDFMSSSLWGFLFEKLNENSTEYTFENTLVDWLNTLLLPGKALPDIQSPVWEMIRNCIEYIGFIYDSDTSYNTILDKKYLVNTLLFLIENNKLAVKVRYNAARVLSRIHTFSPQPLFDFDSDWGLKNWNQWKEQFKNESIKIEACAIRQSTGKRHRVPGYYPIHIAPRCGKPEDKDLEKEVSTRLMQIIKNKETHNYIRINCTYTLILWGYRVENVKNEIPSAIEIAQSVNDDHSIKNLTHAAEVRAYLIS